jgi:hypothetical protein
MIKTMMSVKNNKSIKKRLKYILFIALILLICFLSKSVLLFFVETGFGMNYLLEKPVKDLSYLQKDLKPILTLKISQEDIAKIKLHVGKTIPNFYPNTMEYNYILICNDILLFSETYVVFCSDNPNKNPKKVAWPVMCRLDKIKDLEIKAEVISSQQSAK